MSGGGGEQTTNTVSQPYSQAIPYLTSALRNVSTAANQPASYYPGQLTVGPTTAENNAFSQLNNWDSQVFNGNSLNFGGVSGSLNGQLGGGGYAALSDPTSNAGQLVSKAFQVQQAPSIGNYGWDASISPGQSSPTFGVAGDLDARAALQSQLSGQPDYASVQGSIDAANAPLLRDFQNNLLPSLNSRATFLNNATGGYKALATAIPDLAQRMSENALQVTEGERQRALSAQQNAAQLISQGGLSSYGLGLNTAQAQQQANAALGGQMLSQDQAGANAQQGYLSSLLGYGNLAGSLAGGSSEAAGRALALAPSIYQLGSTPNTNALNYASYDRNLQEQALAADQAKYNYLRDYPQQQAGWYANQIAGLSGLGGTQQTTTTAPGSSPLMGALGGAATGAALGSVVPVIGTGVGAIAGGLLGLFSS